MTASSMQSLRGRSSRAAVLMAAGALLAMSVGAAGASAGVDSRNADNSFTKWATGPGTPPVVLDMAGIVGGDVGAGSFSGEVLSFDQVGNVATIHAIYHFHGGVHSFTADVHVVQTDLSAVINGVVTEGWLKDNQVAGAYTQITCSHDSTTTDCFQGTLSILRGSKH